MMYRSDKGCKSTDYTLVNSEGSVPVYRRASITKADFHYPMIYAWLSMSTRKVNLLGLGYDWEIRELRSPRQISILRWYMPDCQCRPERWKTSSANAVINDDFSPSHSNVSFNPIFVRCWRQSSRNCCLGYYGAIDPQETSANLYLALSWEHATGSLSVC